MSELGLGAMVCTNQLGARTISSVLAAAQKAGFDEELVYSVKPRNAFIRAARQIKKDSFTSGEITSDGVLTHKFRDDETCIEFQFSKIFLQAHGVNYDPAAVVSFDKNSMQIGCINETIKALAETLYNKALGEFNCNDLNSLINRVLVKAGCKRILIRDGVYFIPQQYLEIADKLCVFLQSLNFWMFRGIITDKDKIGIAKEIVSDIRKTINELQEEVIKKKTENKLSRTVARNRLKELKDLLRNYREAANSIQVSLSDIIKDAGEAGNLVMQIGTESVDALIAKVQRGDTSNILPVVCDLISAQEDFEISPMQSTNIQKVDIVLGEEE